MSEIIQFVAMPFDLTDDGLVAGEPFKCETPTSAIERAKAMWKIFSHSGAVAFVRAGYPETRTTVLRKFGNVPDDLQILQEASLYPTTLRLALARVAMRRADDLGRLGRSWRPRTCFRAICSGAREAVLVPPDVAFAARRDRIAKLAADARLPTIIFNYQSTNQSTN